MLARFYMDSVHFQECHLTKLPKEVAGGWGYKGPDFPCVKGLGPLLVADLLVNYLAKAQAALAALTEPQRAELRWQLPAAVYPESTRSYRTRWGEGRAWPLWSAL